MNCLSLRVFFLILLGCGVYSARSRLRLEEDETVYSNKLANCTFHREKSILSCQYLNGIPLDCDVAANLTALNSFGQPIMGLAKHPLGLPQTANNTHFHIYSRPSIKNATLDTRLWQDFKFKRQNKRVYIELSHVQETGHTGFRVVDAKCFSKLIELFDRVKETEKIQVRGSHKRAKIFALIKLS